MKRTYLITGARGHLASTIIQYLRREDCHIRGLILPTETGQDDAQLTYYRGDVTKPETLAPFFAGLACNEVIVIHAAGLISIGSGQEERLRDVNVLGTRNVIAACRRNQVRRLVYVSSVHAIPQQPGAQPVREAAQFSPRLVTGAYAATKAEATQAVLDAGAAGLDVVVVHPSGIFGPYDGGSNHMVQLIQLAISGRLPAGVKGGYDFVDVRDVAKGCLLAAEHGQAGNCYILSNRYLSIRELLQNVRAVAGGLPKPCLPLGLARAFVPLFGAVARLTHTRPLFTNYALDTIASGERFCHDKATQELGYQPRALLCTVQDTIAWLQGQPVPLDAPV